MWCLGGYFATTKSDVGGFGNRELLIDQEWCQIINVWLKKNYTGTSSFHVGDVWYHGAPFTNMD